MQYAPDALFLFRHPKQGGKTGIRTPDTLLAYTRFPGVPLQPLEHLSLKALSTHSVQNGCKLQHFYGI